MSNLYSTNQMKIAIAKTIENEILNGADEKMADLLELVFNEYLSRVEGLKPSATIN